MTLLKYQPADSAQDPIEIAPGERLLLLGPTGCGKTTLLRRLAMLRDTDGARLEFQGRQVLPEDVAAYRAQAILVAQSGYRARIPARESWEALFRLDSWKGADSKACTERLLAHLAALGLERIWKNESTLDILSGGELQGWSLARSVALEPRILFLDEPTSAMDGLLKARAERLLVETYRGAWIWVTHDAEQVRRLSSQARPYRLAPLTPTT